MRDPSLHPSERAFDLALLDSPPEGFATHLGSCEQCRVRLDQLRGELEAFRAGDDPVRAARHIVDRVAQRRWWTRLTRWAWLPALGGAAAAMLLVAQPPEVRTKGGPRLTVYVQAGATPKPWDGSPLRAGERIQLELDAGPASPAVKATVFTVDAGCAIDLDDSLTVERARVLPHSWTLRGEEGGERLYVAFASRAVSGGELGAALREAGACASGLAPDLRGKDFVARGILLRKKVSP